MLRGVLRQVAPRSRGQSKWGHMTKMDLTQTDIDELTKFAAPNGEIALMAITLHLSTKLGDALKANSRVWDDNIRTGKEDNLTHQELADLRMVLSFQYICLAAREMAIAVDFKIHDDIHSRTPEQVDAISRMTAVLSDIHGKNNQALAFLAPLVSLAKSVLK